MSKFSFGLDEVETQVSRDWPSSSERKCLHFPIRTLMDSQTSASGGRAPVDSTETTQSTQQYSQFASHLRKIIIIRA